MNLDIDRLHMEDKGRGEGRTVEVLIKALQNSEFSESDVAVIAHNMHWAGELRKLAVELAAEMGYEVDENRRYEFRINNVWYFFLSKERLRRFQEGRRNTVTFFDNSVGSCAEMLSRARESIKKFTDKLKSLDDSIRSTDKKMRLIRVGPKSKNGG